jgi:hypothetical protein
MISGGIYSDQMQFLRGELYILIKQMNIILRGRYTETNVVGFSL